MVGWYNPKQLGRTAGEVFISTVFGRHADRRLIESLSDSEDFKEKLYYDFSDEKKAEMWVDYISDVGDGFNSSYTMAYHLARPQLEMALFDDPKTKYTTEQGEILIFGGDEVYPTASMESYNDRLIKPYKTAYSKKNPIIPTIFAIPGNHDWYDSLVSFSKIFCEGHKFFGSRSIQNRSYFAIKLIKGWWLFGTDMQLGSALDTPQINYFAEVMKKLEPNDRIILCNAEPHWLYSELYKNDPAFDNRNMGYFEGHILQRRVAVYIAGDRHYYRRHEDEKTGKQKITAGGGGAFLHPTHNENVDQIGKRDIYKLKSSFPDAATSKRLGWRNFFFLFYNPWFGAVTGILYLLTARAFLSQLGNLGLSQFVQALNIVVHDTITQPFSLYWVLAIFVGFLVFTDTYSKAYRLIAGPIHGIVHLLAVFFISWGTSYFISGGQGLDFSSTPQLLLIGLMIVIGGWIFGSIIMGVYLFISLNIFGRHHNEAFSSLKIADYKNFLRLKIESNGDLVIFPVAVRRVCKNWKDNTQLENDPRIIPDDEKATQPELIEQPIIVKREPKFSKAETDLGKITDEEIVSDPRIKTLDESDL